MNTNALETLYFRLPRIHNKVNCFCSIFNNGLLPQTTQWHMTGRVIYAGYVLEQIWKEMVVTYFSTPWDMFEGLYVVYTGCFKRNSKYFGRLYYRLFRVEKFI
jgi:hypothetical protein